MDTYVTNATQFQESLDMVLYFFDLDHLGIGLEDALVLYFWSDNSPGTEYD
jgi:hypothetical protein